VRHVETKTESPAHVGVVIRGRSDLGPRWRAVFLVVTAVTICLSNFDSNTYKIFTMRLAIESSCSIIRPIVLLFIK